MGGSTNIVSHACHAFVMFQHIVDPDEMQAPWYGLNLALFREGVAPLEQPSP